MLALARGCALLTESGAGILHSGGRWQKLAEQAGAMARAGQDLLIAAGDEVLVFDEAGGLQARFAGARNATALARVGALPRNHQV